MGALNSNFIVCMCHESETMPKKKGIYCCCYCKMSLTEKEKRVIVSPNSFSKNNRKSTRYRARAKIGRVIEDVKFISEHHDEILQELGINVFEDDGRNGISEYIMGTTTTKTTTKDDCKKDSSQQQQEKSAVEIADEADPDML